MYYLLCKHRVEDYTVWRRVFDADTGAQREAGLHVLHILRDKADPNLVVMLFRMDDPDRAAAFMEAPAASEHAEASGVLGVPEVMFLSD